MNKQKVKVVNNAAIIFYLICRWSRGFTRGRLVKSVENFVCLLTSLEENNLIFVVQMVQWDFLAYLENW